MYPEDWEQVIAAINSSSSNPPKPDTVFQEGLRCASCRRDSGLDYQA
ncbi:hypothetical protein VU12_05685 [Desulfobulbus sp. US4]|nr:hypothetical protein [Desulfobulbus sp. US4]